MKFTLPSPAHPRGSAPSQLDTISVSSPHSSSACGKHGFFVCTADYPHCVVPESHMSSPSQLLSGHSNLYMELLTKFLMNIQFSMKNSSSKLPQNQHLKSPVASPHPQGCQFSATLCQVVYPTLVLGALWPWVSGCLPFLYTLTAQLLCCQHFLVLLSSLSTVCA